MNYELLKDIVRLAEVYEMEKGEINFISTSVDDFKRWVSLRLKSRDYSWERKTSSRTLESVVTILLVPLDPYGKIYFTSALTGSEFSKRDDGTYLFNLEVYGPMSKTGLIRKTVDEKSDDMQIISRLLAHKWGEQRKSDRDKRRKIIAITPKGNRILSEHKDVISRAVALITGGLTKNATFRWLYLLQNFERFHRSIYEENYESSELCNKVEQTFLNGLHHV